MRSSSSGNKLNVHVVINSWPGKEENALHIEQCLTSYVRRVTVIHSLTGNSGFSLPSHWNVLPDGSYYGVKFAESLKLHDTGVVLQIQADAQHTHWREVVKRCARVFAENSNIAVWTPEIHWSAFKLRRGKVRSFPYSGLTEVLFTDGIVWAIAQPVFERLKKMDYTRNIFGWGIELASAVHAKLLGMAVVHDRTVVIRHPEGTAYNISSAAEQQRLFIDQMSEEERRVAKDIVDLYHSKRQPILSLLEDNQMLLFLRRLLNSFRNGRS